MLIETVWRAIEIAECNGREGPFGGYDYGHNEAFYGKAPEGGRYVIRDFRDPSSPTWGKWLHQTDDSVLHDETYERMTQEHIAKAAILATLRAVREPSEAAVSAGEQRFVYEHHNACYPMAFDFEAHQAASQIWQAIIDATIAELEQEHED